MLIFIFIIFQTIVFGIVIYALRRIVFKDTESSVNRLQNSYEEINKKKEELAHKVRELENEYKKKKEEADQIVMQMKEQAQKEAYELRQDAFKKAKAESEDIITKAYNTVNKTREVIYKELEAKMMEYCGELLKNILGNVARNQVHDTLVKEFIAELRNTEVEKISLDCDSIEILTVKNLGEHEKDEIKKIVFEKTKKSFPLSEKIDDSLLSGVILKFGSLVLDGSLAAKIKEAVADKKQKIEDR